jgi:hypothetical protein
MHAYKLFLILIAALQGPVSTVSADDASIAIIDSSENTAPHLDGLARLGVKVIGRYYARCPQPDAGLPHKRLVDTGDELKHILDHPAGFGVFSIYQFYSASELKFKGQYEERGTGKVRNLPVPDSAGDWFSCTHPKEANSPEEEGRLDGTAAAEQAERMGQPTQTPVFFGVDFNASADVMDAVQRYFDAIGKVLRPRGYLVGAYGNGQALNALKKSGLVDFMWINASRGHAGNVEFYNVNKWHLFQSRTDIKLPTGENQALEVDTDVQNKNVDGYVGFWTRKGRFELAPERTLAAFDQRRFACEGRTVLLGDDLKPLPNGIACGVAKVGCDPYYVGRTAKPDDDLQPRVCFGNVVRLSEQTQGDFVKVDCDEDGELDGWVSKSHLSRSFSSRPAYENDRNLRRAITAASVCP